MDYAVARRKMAQDQLIARGIRDPQVLRAMEQVPRHAFVPPGLANQAYKDHPLNIGDRQTISQPYIVALMSESLNLKPGNKVLEIGTGSGYQTAILYAIGVEIYSIERIKDLSNKARKLLYSLGCDHFQLRIGDGTQGWPEAAPFDAIIVTAGAPNIPEPLIQQLKEGGRLVIPVGDEEAQELFMCTKQDGKLLKQKLTGCRFVKLLGEHGWRYTGT
jgi:protein-L-isoaspartate(D-aspartate) O-methyltransferase